MEFLVQLGKQLENPYYREMVGINDPMDIFMEYIDTMDADHRQYGSARPECSPKLAELKS